MWVTTTNKLDEKYVGIYIRVSKRELTSNATPKTDHKIEFRFGKDIISKTGWEVGKTRLAVARGVGEHKGHIVLYPHPEGFVLRSRGRHKGRKSKSGWYYIVFAATKWNLRVVDEENGYPWEQLKNIVIIRDGEESRRIRKSIGFDGVGVMTNLPSKYSPMQDRVVVWDG